MGRDAGCCNAGSRHVIIVKSTITAYIYFAPVLEELSKEYAGVVDIYKVNVDDEEELAAAFGIRSIPTLLFIPLDGKPKIVQGALPKNQLKATIESIR